MGSLYTLSHSTLTKLQPSEVGIFSYFIGEYTEAPERLSNLLKAT